AGGRDGGPSPKRRPANSPRPFPRRRRDPVRPGADAKRAPVRHRHRQRPPPGALRPRGTLAKHRAVEPAMSDLTAILERLRAGDPYAPAALFAHVYAELRRIAGRQVRADEPAEALTPTELVHEAYLRLFAGATPTFADRSYFFAAAAQAMRRVRVDH